MKQAQFYYKDESAPQPNRPNHIGSSVLIVLNDKLLLESRTDSDYWSIIGGSLEPNETLKQCQ